MAALLLLAWWSAGRRRSAPPPLVNAGRPVISEDAGVAPPKRPVPAVPRPEPVEKSAANCRPGASLRCHLGDVWSVNGCGEFEGKRDECGDAACHGGMCDAPLAGCEEPPEGRCDGKVVVLCRAGRTQRIDCAAQGLSCAIGEEGAECVAPIPPDQRCAGAPRCVGDVLTFCSEGRIQRQDCAAQRARCLQMPGTREPACFALNLEPEGKCGPCGCPPAAGASESECDGQDDDGDKRVDEGLDCGAVPVLAFVVTDARGESSYAPEDIEAEIARVNGLFASSQSDSPLSFVLDGLVMLNDPELLAVDGREMARLIFDPRVHPARDEFYVPLVFTDEVVAGGGTPKFGISTLPNGTCGGMQQQTGPDVGIVVVAKARAPTTVAHEIGHFLGLCHTHAELAAPAQPGFVDARGAPAACAQACSLGGDGICDTPFDPGPELCAYDAQCSAQCRGGDEPDATNLMSYYTACRRRFTSEQELLMEHSLALRRAWHPCVGGQCTCQLGAAGCPAGMSCRLVRTSNGIGPRCTLDGPLAPRSACDDPTQCGAGAICLQEQTTGARRCTRLCQVNTPDCRCVQAGDLSVCREDVGS